MNKILIGLIVAIVIAGGIGGTFFYFFIMHAGTPSVPTQTDTTSGGLPSSNPTSVPVTTGGSTGTPLDDSVMSVVSTDGGTLQISNIKKDPALKEDSANPGYYYFGNTGSASSSASSPYIIEYIDSTQYFNIVLTQEPIGPAREAAQAYLTAHLGITEAQLCKLNYMVSVPYKVNQDFSSMNLGFSVCPGAEAL